MVLISALLIGCKGDPIEEVDFGYEYVPLTVGSYIDYDVDSIVYDEFAGTKTVFHFVLRERIAEVYENLNQQPVYRIERSKKLSDTSEFAVYESYALTMDGTRLERLRNNLRTIPLIFPPRSGELWDGNAFNKQSRTNYSYDYVHVSQSISGQRFDSTLRVLHWVDTNTLIEKRFSEERYARGKGLIYKEFFDVETNFNVDSGLHWIQSIRH